jgi:hypothetical protein
MSLNQLWRRLIRRPIVLTIMIVLAALGVFVGWTSVDPEAESTAAVLVVPPWTSESEMFPNPLLNLGDRATALATTLVAAIQTSDVKRATAEAGATDYQVSNLAPESLRDPIRSAVIEFVVKGPNPEAAHSGAESLIVQSRAVLRQMQLDAKVGPDYQVYLQVIKPPQQTTTVGSRQIRAAAAFGAAVFITGMLLSWAVEWLIDRRSRLRDRRSGDSREQDPGLHRRQDESRNSADTKPDAPIAPARQPT